MTTPLIILGILILPAIGVRLWIQHTKAAVDPNLGGVFGLSSAFVFFGVGHFVQTSQMVEMLPPWVPGRLIVIYLTGLLEWVLAATLLIPTLRRAAGWTCIVILVLFFPANIYSALNETGMGGHQWGPIYLLIRAPLQLLLIAWAYWFTVREGAHEHSH